MRQVTNPIKPQLITSPIQLTAAWFTALVFLCGLFLHYASKIDEPVWITPLLSIAATIFVILAGWGIYFLQTTNRDQLLSDQHYFDLRMKHAQLAAATDTALPPQNDPLSSPITQSKEVFDDTAKAILATLWKYQNKHFGISSEKRWTFTIYPHSPNYGNYLVSLGLLINRGLVAVNTNYHCMLTTPGIIFMQDNDSLQTEDNLFKF
jgi:hypothetical protein